MNDRLARIFLTFAAVAAAAALWALPESAEAQDSARVRVVHASPDAPAVDILVDGSAAFTNVPFQSISDYAELPAGTYNVQVVPTGETEPVVIEADLDLAAGQDYTVVATGLLENIEPLVLEDNNGEPASGKAHVRFVHASPDAPAVDIAVAGGPVVFSDIAFQGTGTYTPVDAMSYDFEVRPAGSEDVALEVPGVALEAGNVYTVFAMGLLDDGSLTAVPSVDATYEQMAAADEGADEATEAPTTMPRTGAETLFPWLLALGALLALGGGVLRFAPDRQR